LRARQRRFATGPRQGLSGTGRQAPSPATGLRHAEAMTGHRARLCAPCPPPPPRSRSPGSPAAPTGPGTAAPILIPPPQPRAAAIRAARRQTGIGPHTRRPKPAAGPGGRLLPGTGAPPCRVICAAVLAASPVAGPRGGARLARPARREVMGFAMARGPEGGLPGSLPSDGQSLSGQSLSPG
jgi:hypothetical protein